MHHAEAWHGMAKFCPAWHGMAWQIKGCAWHGMAWHCDSHGDMHGMAWHGMARLHGMAWHGNYLAPIKIGMAMHGKINGRHGNAWQNQW